MTPYRDRIGHRKLVRLTLAWWAVATDKKAHETEKAKAYRAMTAHLRAMAEPPEPDR